MINSRKRLQVVADMEVINAQCKLRRNCDDVQSNPVPDLNAESRLYPDVPRFKDLPSDVLKRIISLLPQADLISLNLTCWELHHLVNQQLYCNIYITDHHIREKSASWSVLYNGRSQTNKIRQFELSLQSNYRLIPLIKRIISDDLSFLLFKLKCWSRIFFEPNLGLCQISSVYFGNVPMNHFNSAYDDLMLFYRVSNGAHKLGNQLKQVQLRGLHHLVGLIDNGYINEDLCRLEDISFVVMDLSEINLEKLPFSNYRRIKRKLVRIFGQLSALSVVSVHGLGLKFIDKINQFLQGDLMFNNVDRLRINHCHGQTRNEDAYELCQETQLDFDVIAHNFNLAKVKVLDLKIGCNHLHEVLGCGCEQQFMYAFTHSAIKAKELTIERIDKSVLANPFNLIHFKQLVQYYLQGHCGDVFSKLTINSNGELYPFFQYEEGEVESLRKRVNEVNSQLVQALGGVTVRRLIIPDYIESFCNWQVDLMEILPRMAEVSKFIHVNEQIQFYLNPVIGKSYNHYLYDLVSTILRLLRHRDYSTSPRGNSSIGDNETNAQAHDKTSNSSHQQAWIPPADNDYQGPMCHIDLGEVDLHKTFRHDTYKELVNYNLVKNMMNRRWIVHGSGPTTRITTAPDIEGKSRQIDIHCECTGDELVVFVEAIKQQVSNHIGGFAAADEITAVHETRTAQTRGFAAASEIKTRTADRSGFAAASEITVNCMRPVPHTRTAAVQNHADTINSPH